jgi:hypothetical protein
MIRKLLTVFTFGTIAIAGSLSPAAAQQYQALGYAPPPHYDRTFRDFHHVQGWVTSFSGFDLTVRIHGVGQPVNLHQGTILRPLGLTIVPGMLLRADGYFNGNGLFIAEQITLIR